MVKIFPDPDSTVQALADFVVRLADESITKSGQFNFALSGGSSPKALYRLLASERYKKKINWSRIYFFFGDERHVPQDHPDSNFLMARETLFFPLRIPADQVFPVNTTLPPAESARNYELDIIKHFGQGQVRFDLILLGLGDNSHTASLFPHTTILNEQKALVKEVFVEELKKYRISLTAPAINLAHHIAFLVYGSGKAGAVDHILQGSYDFEQFPAQLIRPAFGDVTWFLDEAAAVKIRLET